MTRIRLAIALLVGVLLASSAYAWRGGIVPAAGGGSPLANGIYFISSGADAIDGSFGWAGQTPRVQLYANSEGFGQAWTWNGLRWSNDAVANGGGSIPATDSFMSDNNNGTVTETTPGDTWTAILVSSSTFKFLNNRTGMYLSVVSGALAMSATQTVWTLVQPGGPQSFVSASLSNSAFVAQAGNANTTIGTFNIALSPISPSFSGTCTSLGGADAALFAVNSACVLRVGASDVTTVRAYTVTVTGTQSSPPVTPSPFTSAAITVNGVAPSGGTPAAAVAAGFTELAYTADFSLGAYSNLATWMEGCGGPTSGFRWSQRWFQQGISGCVGLSMENDPSIGQQVLHWQFLPAWNAPGTNVDQQVLILSYPEVQGNTGNYFPVTMYHEMTFRIAEAGLSQAHGLNIFGAFPATGNGHDRWLEPDFLEVITNTNTGDHTWEYGDGTLEWTVIDSCPTCPIINGIFASPPNGLKGDVTVYHTYGTLLTTDGTSRYAKCVFVDRVSTGCGSFTMSHPEIIGQHDQVLSHNLGGGNANYANGAIINNIDVYISKIQVWTCPGAFGTATQCYNPYIDHWPFP